MALLFMDGFDAGDSVLKWAVSKGSGNITSVTGSNTRFGVGAAVSLYGAQINHSYLAASHAFVGMAIRPDSTTGSNGPYLSLFGDGGTTVHLTLIQTASGFQLLRGSNTGTLLASYTGGALFNTWHYLEIGATISSTTGTVQVYLDGAKVIDFTGNTKNGGTNTSTDMVQIGPPYVNTTVYDDLYICDDTGSANNTFLGDVRVQTLSPAGAGASTGFTPSAAPNYSCVNQMPYSAAKYVSATAPGTKDTYTLSGLQGSGQAVIALQNCLIAKKTDAGSAQLKSVLRVGSTDYPSAGAAVAASDTTLVDLRALNPATGVAWTPGDLATLQAGMQIA